jgi:hypothetical protein
MAKTLRANGMARAKAQMHLFMLNYPLCWSTVPHSHDGVIRTSAGPQRVRVTCLPSNGSRLKEGPCVSESESHDVDYFILTSGEFDCEDFWVVPSACVGQGLTEEKLESFRNRWELLPPPPVNENAP